jgi:hypothetical protein
LQTTEKQTRGGKETKRRRRREEMRMSMRWRRRQAEVQEEEEEEEEDTGCEARQRMPPTRCGGGDKNTVEAGRRKQ